MFLDMFSLHPAPRLPTAAAQSLQEWSGTTLAAPPILPCERLSAGNGAHPTSFAQPKSQSFSLTSETNPGRNQCCTRHCQNRPRGSKASRLARPVYHLPGQRLKVDFTKGPGSGGPVNVLGMATLTCAFQQRSFNQKELAVSGLLAGSFVIVKKQSLPQ